MKIFNIKQYVDSPSNIMFLLIGNVLSAWHKQKSKTRAQRDKV